MVFPEAVPDKKEKPVVVNKEQLNDAVMSSPTGNSEVHVEMAPVTSASQKKIFLKDGKIYIPANCKQLLKAVKSVFVSLVAWVWMLQPLCVMFLITSQQTYANHNCLPTNGACLVNAKPHGTNPLIVSCIVFTSRT